MTKNVHQELLRRLKAAKDAGECSAVMLDAMAAVMEGSITPQQSDQLNQRLMKRLEKHLEGINKVAMTDGIAHSNRFRKVSNLYPHRVAEAYGGDLHKARADTDEQVAATVAAWEREQGLEPVDWAAIGAEERAAIG